MSLHSGYQALHINELAQASTTDIRHRSLCTVSCIKLFIHGVITIGVFNQFTSIGCKNLAYFLTDRFLETGAPVIAMYNDVRL